MNLEFLSASAVVAAQSHNPTILHPSFLEARAIVPKEWKPSDVVCTPPVALVKYQDGNFSITVDGTKLQVLDSAPGLVPENSLVAGIAAGYIATLPHVKYTAVGLNLGCFVKMNAAESYVLSRFLNPESKWQKEYPLEAMGLKMIFPLPSGGLLHLSVDAGSIKRAEEEKQSGLVINANCHFPLSQEKPLDAAQEILAKFADTYRVSQKYTRAVLGIEGNANG